MEVNRIIGQHDGGLPGPKLIFTAGIHGNEPSGVLALEAMFHYLQENSPSFKGSIVGIAGNLSALKQGSKFIDCNLNGLWLSENKEEQIGIDDTIEIEYKEKAELIETFNKVLSSHTDEVYFIDLHSTTSESIPFIGISDTLRNRKLAKMVSLPIILGIEESLHGTLFDAVSRSGFPSLLFHAGLEGEPKTMANHKGIIWKTLETLCEMDPGTSQDAKESTESLESATAHSHEFYEVIYKHRIKENSGFKMNPGYKNFQPIKKHESIATINGKNVTTPSKGNIFLPAYQQRGDVGFYIIRAVGTFWIRFSSNIRKTMVHRSLHWLAGVNKISSNPLTFKVDERFAFLWALEIFHLLGYRKDKQEGPFLFMVRREDENKTLSTGEAIKQLKTQSYINHKLQWMVTDYRIPFSPGQKKRTIQ